MFRNKKYNISPKLGMKVYRHKDGWHYFWIFISLAFLSCFLCFFLEFYELHFNPNNVYKWYNYKTQPERFIDTLFKGLLITSILLILIMFILDIFMEFKNLTRYCYTRAKNINLSRRFLIISCCIIGGITAIWGFSQIISKPSLSPELKAWEKLAENGDTVSLHKLLNWERYT